MPLPLDEGGPLQAGQAVWGLADTLSVGDGKKSGESNFSVDAENAETAEGVLAHFIHKLNNATATILGKAQITKMAVLKGQIADPQGKLMPALQSIEASVAKICEAVELLELLSGSKKGETGLGPSDHE